MRTNRVPISTGFAISFSADQRAISHGKTDAEAVEYLQNWLDEHPNGKRAAEVCSWLVLKTRELAQAEADQRAVSQHLNTEAHIENAVTEKKLRGHLAELFREYARLSFAIRDMLGTASGS
jgi:phage terminase Nu1 subunit (DNA packaging protein)